MYRNGKINNYKIHRIVFAELENLSPGMSTILAGFDCNFTFSKIEIVSPQTIEPLASLKNKSIHFPSLRKINVEVAESMAKLNCKLLVLGIEAIDNESSFQIFGTTSNLALSNLQEVDNENINQIIKRFQGRSISFSKAKSLSEHDQELLKKANFEYSRINPDESAFGFLIESRNYSRKPLK